MSDEQRRVRIESNGDTERIIEERDRLYATHFKSIERLIDERDRLYDTRFKLAETAVSAALAAQEKSTTSAFAASEKAIGKAEDAQRDYNVRSNEFRGQLDDQAKTLMPRTEVQTMVRSIEDKLYEQGKNFDAKLSQMAATSEKTISSIIEELKGLRVYQASGGGREEAHKDSAASTRANLAVVISLLVLLILSIKSILGK